MTPEEAKLAEAAKEFARQNRKEIAAELTDVTRFKPDTTPLSVFMAGSPGAGKTEFSKALLDLLHDSDHHVLRIDSDDLRSRLPGYTGDNSYLFQGAVSLITEKVHDMALANSQSFIFDGTLSKYDKAANNIHRSIDKGHGVFIFYVYQQPEVAWKFTQAREQAEGRHIPRAAFIEQFLGARQVVEKILSEFKDQVTVYLVRKNFEQNTVEMIEQISVDRPIDAYIKESYTVDNLEQIL